MPIYEYQCTNCAHKIEVLQKFSDEPLKDCPECKRQDMKKLISAASFRLKGEGWYETDFKTGKKKQLAESDSSAGKKEDSGGADNKQAGTKQAESKTAGNKAGGGQEKSSVKAKGSAAKSSGKSR